MLKFLAAFSKKIRILLYISIIIKLLILVAFVAAIVEGQWSVAVLAFAAIIISFIPAFIRDKYKIFLPPEFELAFLFFLYGSFILGELNKFYEKFIWWDLLLHSLSAVMLALVGFMIVYSFYYLHKVVFHPIFAALFSFSFAMALGGVWEIYEFSMDSFFGMTMQKSGLVDTMWDLIVDGIAAFVVSTIGFFYMYGGDSLLMERFVKKFIRMNEKHLRKKEQGLI